jgi:hypothetical protein
MVLFKDNLFTKFLLPADLRRAEIQEVLNEMRQEVRKETYEIFHDKLEASFNYEIRPLEDLVHEIQWALSTGASVRDVPLIRYVPVRLYVSGIRVGIEDANRIVQALEEPIRSQLERGREFYFAHELGVEFDSIFKRFWMRTTNRMNQEDVEKKIGAAFELKFLDRPQAEATKHLSEGASALLQALNEVPEATVQIGNLLIAKTTENGQPRVAVRTLTPVELKRLESDRSILKDPRRALELLDQPPTES